MTAAGLAGLDPCVHCGFCLQSCPTYLVTGDEADGPRGRIVLMQGLARGRFDPAQPDAVHYLDRCLGCRACESACPSGVRYGPALEVARAGLARHRALHRFARLVLTTVSDPALAPVAMGLARGARRLAGPLSGPGRLGFLWGMLAASRPPAWRPRGRIAVATRAAPREPVTLFTGCIMQGLFAHVHEATRRVLAVNGHHTTDTPGQTCCGALHAHAGLRDEARDLARRNLEAFGRVSGPVVVNSAGCGAMLQGYAELFAGEPEEDAARRFAGRVRDVSVILAAEGGPVPGGPVPRVVAYDPPCHLQHVQQVTAPPLALLDAIPALRRVAHEEADLCCGSAGLYSVTEPGLSRAVLARKIAAIARSGAELVATGNPGCLLQIGAGLRAVRQPVDVRHPVELLDVSYRAAGCYT